MRYFAFVDETLPVDDATHVELLDLARALSQRTDLRLEFATNSSFDGVRNRVDVSTFWTSEPNAHPLLGMKSDVYLRAYGGVWYTDSRAVARYLQQPFLLPRFARQLFAVFEDLRVQQACIAARPGTRGAFRYRGNSFLPYFQRRIQSHVAVEQWSDALLLSIYCRFASDDHQSLLPDTLAALAQRVANDARAQHLTARSDTAAVAQWCTRWLATISQHLQQDTAAAYFELPTPDAGQVVQVADDNFDDMKRVHPVTNPAPNEAKENDDNSPEPGELWHQETKDAGQPGVQMSLDRGSPSALSADQGRQSADSPAHHMQVVQGSSQIGSGVHDPSHEPPTKRIRDSDQPAKVTSPLPPVDAVRHKIVPASLPSSDEVARYEKLRDDVSPIVRRLQRAVERQIEQMRTSARENLVVGRIGKKLTRVVLEDSPRLFRKKGSPLHRLDAVMLLLVDCSGSMFDRMADTRVGVTLFHEALRHLQVAHAVVGFWEDDEPTDSSRGFTCFQPVIRFEDALTSASGCRILQLHARLDNRDGYAIRVMTRQLLRRPEKHKFVMVFSDGEPAAANYGAEGTYDTHQAVLQARRQGIHVLNILLGDASSNAGIQSIYGTNAITVEDAVELPGELSRVLRRLLVSAT